MLHGVLRDKQVGKANTIDPVAQTRNLLADGGIPIGPQGLPLEFPQQIEQL